MTLESGVEQVGSQSLRQAARRDARAIASRRRAELLERSRRLEDLAVNVMTAIKERDLSMEKAERNAGEALQPMTTAEGPTLLEAVEWCGDSVGLREATRLRTVGGWACVIGTGDPSAAVDSPKTQN